MNTHSFFLRLYDALGWLAEVAIRSWLRLAGKSVARAEAPWLASPIGPPGRIGEQFYRRVAELEGLRLRTGEPGTGLIPDFDLLKGPHFDPAAVHPEIRHFYEHTSLYHLDVWSEATLVARPFLWLLVTLVSRRMEQLNFPVSSLETSRGMSSVILQLVDDAGRPVYSGWLRKLISTGRIVYVGFYTTGQPPGYGGTCVKVTFPVPLGSATVFLRPEAKPDGSFTLTSSGTRFGEPGFYRMLEVDAQRWKVRYLRTLREFFHVWLDDQGALRTDHVVRFLGLTVLRLHYKLSRAP